MRHIEFLGPPGSGKSTLVREVVRSLDGVVGLEEAVHAAIKEHGTDGASRRVARVSGSTSRMWKAAYARSTDRFDALSRFMSAHPRVMEVVLASQRERRDRDRGQDLVLGWVLNLMARYQLADEAGAFGSLVSDEGFSQRGVALFGYGFGPTDQARLNDYLDSIPLPDVVIMVDTPLEICATRLDARGWSERVVGLAKEERLRFLESSAQTVKVVADRVESLGMILIRLDGTRPIAENLGAIRTLLTG